MSGRVSCRKAMKPIALGGLGRVLVGGITTKTNFLCAERATAKPSLWRLRCYLSTDNTQVKPGRPAARAVFKKRATGMKLTRLNRITFPADGNRSALAAKLTGLWLSIADRLSFNQLFIHSWNGLSQGY